MREQFNEGSSAMTEQSPASPPESIKQVVIKQPPLDRSAPSPTSLRTVMVKRVHTDQTDSNSFRVLVVGLCLILAAALGAITLANIAGNSPTDAIRAVPPDQSETPSILADSSSDYDHVVSPATIGKSDRSDLPVTGSSTASETNRFNTNGTVVPSTAAPTTTPPPTRPPPTTPPPTAPATIAPTTSSSTPTVPTVPVTTVPSTAPEPTELPVPPTSLSSTTTESDSVDTKPGRGNSDDAPGKRNKPEKDE